MNNNQLIFYSTPQGNIKVEVVFENETFWITQKVMAQLFGVEVPAISKHLANIYDTKELDKDATISILEIVQQEGDRNVKRKVEYYSLDAILAVGYRVNSKQATQFRIWATNTLKEFITKGFILDDERLKQGKSFGRDYFEELLERIREIRASERRFYQKITDIYALSVDYDKNADTTRDFFAGVQNKLHWAISGKTAAEIYPVGYYGALRKCSIIKLSHGVNLYRSRCSENIYGPENLEIRTTWKNHEKRCNYSEKLS